MSKKKKNKSVRYNLEFISDSWKNDFIAAIPRTKRKKEIINYTNQVDWRRISELVMSEIKALMKKIGIPKKEDPLRFHSSILEGYILTTIKNRLHYVFLYHLVTINRGDSKSEKKNKIEKLLKSSRLAAIDIISNYKTILSSGRIKDIKDSKTLKNEMKNLKQLAQKGELFSHGKQQTPEEIPYFEAVEKEFNELRGTRLEKKRRSIAINVAKFDLGYEHKREQINFYNRYRTWQKLQKK